VRSEKEEVRRKKYEVGKKEMRSLRKDGSQNML
jgi:hypothetical protein